MPQPHLRRLGVGLALVLALAACSGGGDSPFGHLGETAASDTGDAPITETETASETETVDDELAIDLAALVQTFDVGECVDVEDFEVGTVPDPRRLRPIACSAPHGSELYATVDHPSGPETEFPGSTAVRAFADDRCLAAFAGYVGLSYERSALDITFVAPDEPRWAVGDRRVVCLVHDADLVPLTGTVRGSAR